MTSFLRILGIWVLLFMWVLILLPETIVAQQRVRIDGVYSLISETTTLVKPKRKTFYRKPPEWSGLFFFLDGYFSVTFMDQTREVDWIGRFPKNISEIGYESYSGKYDIDGTTLALMPTLELHPLFDRVTRRFEFKVEDDKLILTEKLRPYTEDMRQGETRIVLSKSKIVTTTDGTSPPPGLFIQ